MNNNDMEIKKLLKNDWKYLKHVKPKKQKKSFCNIAISQNHEAIKYVSKAFKCFYSKDVLCKDWHLFRFCDVKMFSLEDWKSVFDVIIKNNPVLHGSEKRIFANISIAFVEQYSDNYINQIIEKFLDSMIIDKFYKDGTFTVKKKILDICKEVVYTFSTFDEFYNFVNGNLSNSDIYDFDFKDIDLKKYKIDNVAINSSILKQNGLYDNLYYEKTIKPMIGSLKELVKSDTNEVDPLLHESDVLPYQRWDFLKRCSIYYVSDIHLDEKIVKKFKDSATELEVNYYIKKLADKMIDSIPYEFGIMRYLLIAGDVSSSFSFSKLFFERVVERKIISPNRIVYVLGNHELWNVDHSVDNKVSDIVDNYRKFFNSIGITFLHNDLVIYNPSCEIINEKRIKEMNDDELRKVTLDSDLIIFGGIGFSAYNPIFNALNGIYLNTITSSNQDKMFTQEFNDIYQKIKRALTDRRIIILTHNPKKDWSNDNYNEKWIYINGHTHKNMYEKNQFRQIYADNQIGYYNENIVLKRIDYSLKCNIFSDYSDGIYNITVDDYYKFYYKMGYVISCKLKGEFYLLKRNNIYMFLYKNEKGIIYIMNGGVRNKLNNNDVRYYYENMNKYSTIIKKGTDSYYKYLSKISQYVKNIGGYGTIHGSIVDIDFFSHIYVNVYDGTITPYWAAAVDFKIIYSSFEELITKHCPALLDNIKKNNSLVPIKNELIPKGGEFDEDTRMYRESRLMKKIQYLIDDNIIRIWNDNVLEENEIKKLLEKI